MASNKEITDWKEVEINDWQDVTEEPPLQKPMSFGEGLGRSALEALPVAGGIAGGLVGAPLGLVGIAGGSGLGAAAGKSLEQMGKSVFFDEQPASTGQMLKEVGTEGALGLLGEGTGQAVTNALKMAAPVAGKVGAKIGSALTGITEQEIKTYAKRADQIKQLAKSSDSNVAEAADQIRQKFADKLKSAKDLLNNSIESTLQTSQSKASLRPVLDELELMKAKINPKLYPEQIKQIDDIVGKISSLGEEVSLLELNQVKRFLQDKASSAYGRPGDIFAVGPEAATAAKGAAAKARGILNELVPQVKQANDQFAKLHDIDDVLNKNILREGKPEASLLAAGSGANQRNASALSELGDMVGMDIMGEAKDLAAMRTFTNPPIMPVDTTGKAAARMGAAGLVGMGVAGPVGAAVGTVAASPTTLKAAIDVGRAMSGKVPVKELTKGATQLIMGQPSKTVNESKTDRAAIIEKVKGTPYEQVLNNAYQKGGDKSFAAANYVLKNQDEKYRKLFEGEQ